MTAFDDFCPRPDFIYRRPLDSVFIKVVQDHVSALSAPCLDVVWPLENVYYLHKDHGFFSGNLYVVKLPICHVLKVKA